MYLLLFKKILRGRFDFILKMAHKRNPEQTLFDIPNSILNSFAQYTNYDQVSKLGLEQTYKW